ncbi:MAG: ATP-binding cassette domain-containing protein [Acidimicrobiales bacterium]|jgi:simple sugar transport system ATP-binding protein
MTDPRPLAAADDVEQGKVVLRTEGITKRFGAVVVLRGVDIHLKQGEVLGLVGDNGAGKSTFVKILCGFLRPDSGRIILDGKDVEFHSVREARRHGIEALYQDLALVPQLTVYQNLFLNREQTFGGRLGFVRRRKMRELARQHLHQMNVNVPSVEAEVEQLSGGQRQAIAVARATLEVGKVLLLDEPLAAMGAKESALIIDLVHELSASGDTSMIVIDHNYAHLFELCDRVNVLQDGKVTLDKIVRDTSIEELTELMLSEYRLQVLTARTQLKGRVPEVST